MTHKGQALKKHRLVQNNTVDEFGIVLSTNTRYQELGEEPQPRAPVWPKSDTSVPHSSRRKAPAKPLLPLLENPRAADVPPPPSGRSRRRKKPVRQPRSAYRPSPQGAKLHARCPHCSASMRVDRIADHIERIHGARARHISAPLPAASETFVQSPYCSVQVKVRNLPAHLKRIHRIQPQRKHQSSRPATGHPVDSDGQAEEALFEDREQDGGRYLGYFARENGQFGSIPLYDDHSDEADAD